MQLFWQQTVNGLGEGSIIVIFALGFSLIFSHLGILNVAQGTYATWGAITSFYVYEDLGHSIWLSAVLGTLAAGGIGIAVDLVCFTPLRGRGRGGGLFSTLITSIGAWIALLSLAQLTIGANANGFPPGATPTRVFRVFGLQITSMVLVGLAAAIAVSIIMWILIDHTHFGASVRAIGRDPRTIAIAGVNTRVVVLWTAFLAAALSGLGGVLSGMTDNVITYDLGESLLVVGFAAVVLGGVGSITGTVIGGFAIGLIQVYSAQYISSSFQDAITYTALLLVLVARPRGLLGRSQLIRA